MSVTDDVFGDPCLLVVKHLTAKLTCGAPNSTSTASSSQQQQPNAVSYPPFTYNVSVPAGSSGSVVMPTFGSAAGGLVIAESGQAVWSGGAFVAGVAGVFSAKVETDATGSNVRFEIGSGDYSFSVQVTL